MAENYYYSTLSGDEIESRLVGGVVFNADQTLTTSQKARARANIGAGESDSTFKVLGYFDTYEDMIESLQQIPAPGDAYGIGTASPYDIYVYDGVHDTWVNNGPIVLSDAVIDDEDIALDTTWSSSKINTEVGAVRTLANAAQSAADAAQTTADGKAPTSHASTATTYGVGNGTNYGHVKLSDTPDTNQDVGSGVAATPAAVQSVLDKATLVVEMHTVDNYSVGGNTSESINFTGIAKTGYTTIGIVGAAISNATSSGTLSSYCAIKSFFASGNGATLAVRNNNNSTAKIKADLYILYQKT